MSDPASIKLFIGGREFEARPLTIRKIRELAPVIASLTGSLGDAANLDKMVQVIHVGLERRGSSALRRFFTPRVSTAWLQEHLDAKTTLTALDAIMKASGLVAAPQGDVQRQPAATVEAVQ